MSLDKTDNTIPLDDPVTVDGREVTSLTVRKPKVRDVRLAKKTAKTPDDVEVILFANLCGVTVEVIDDLTLGDYTRLSAKVADFLPQDVLERMLASVAG